MSLKKISHDAIPRAIQKAERYRLLNQSWATESICLDVLEVDPANQQVLVMLLLSITDQFGDSTADLAHRAKGLLPRITDPYQRAYYAGIIAERQAHARLARGHLGSEAVAHGGLREAMRHFEEAEGLRPAGNDDAILRWNTCARFLDRMSPGATRDEDEYEPSVGE